MSFIDQKLAPVLSSDMQTHLQKSSNIFVVPKDVQCFETYAIKICFISIFRRAPLIQFFKCFVAKLKMSALILLVTKSR